MGRRLPVITLSTASRPACGRPSSAGRIGISRVDTLDVKHGR
jgi:hypothetical protein